MTSKLEQIANEIKEVKDKGFTIIYNGLESKFITAVVTGIFEMTVSGPPEAVKMIQLEVEMHDPNA